MTGMSGNMAGAEDEALTAPEREYQRDGTSAFQAAHVGAQCRRNGDAAIGVLVVLQNGDQRPAHRQPGTVQRMHSSVLPLSLRKRACMRRAWKAPKLEHEEISR